MAVADTKGTPIQRPFLAFSDQNKISKKNRETGQRSTTGCWFLLDYTLNLGMHKLGHKKTARQFNGRFYYIESNAPKQRKSNKLNISW